MTVATLTNQERAAMLRLLNSDPVDWIEQHFYIPDPRDPVTGERLGPGPIRLAEHQKRLLRGALTMQNGLFPYGTILYSTIKKSGKTALAAAVAMWYADIMGPYNEIYCVANDGKQASDRILQAIIKAITLNPNNNWKITKTKVTLPTGTFIEAIPCDPQGQAGSNPGLSVWSEMWGFGPHKHKERLWSEMTVPPTRHGLAFRWVESYAGFSGESDTLERLYTLGRVMGRRHPLYPDLPVYVNPRAGLFAYWDEDEKARRMPWQTEDYYASEASTLTPSEFRRIHMNKWVSAQTKAIPIEWWDRCQGTMSPLDPREPVIVALDAAVSGACCAAILVSRHPERPETGIAVRGVRIFEPPPGGTHDLTETLERVVREWWEEYNVVEIAYDRFQLHKMAKDMRKEGYYFRNFSQRTDRAIADKQLYDLILRREVLHDGNMVLREHVNNAMAKNTGDQKIRFVTPDGKILRPIDGLVALSMGAFECLRLNLT
jgi:phage terminase large subunit-like protein